MQSRANGDDEYATTIRRAETMNLYRTGILFDANEPVTIVMGSVPF